MPESRFDLGVLFVHGVGTQKQGRTLIQFGEPLFRWLFRWFGDGNDSGGDTSNRAVQLTEVELEPGGDPAHCTVTIEVPAPPDAPVPPHKWLLTESWWTEAFTPPPFTRLAFWLLGYVPWLALDYVRRVVRRAVTQTTISALVGLLSIPLLLFIGPILVFLLMLAIFVVLILYLLPIPLTKKIAQSVGVGVAQSIGDAFIVIQNPVDHGAMIQRIERDLAWLSHRCRRIAIVAHSQGAALSHEILAAQATPSANLFLSVGSAVRRLAEIRQLRLGNRRWQLPAWLSLVAGAWLLVGVAAGTVQVLGGNLDRWPWWARGTPLFIGILVALVMLSFAYMWVWRAFTSDRAELLLKAKGTDLQWVDCYATADPVPNGPLLDSGSTPVVDPDGGPLVPYTPRRIFNHRWMVTDHVTYPSNLDQFVSRMARELALTAGLELTIGPEDAARLDQAETIRQKRTSWLSTFRALFIGAALFMVAAVARVGGASPRTSLAEIAKAVRDGTPDWVSGLLNLLITPFEGALQRLGVSQDELVGALVLALVLAGMYGLVVASWSFWDRRDTDRLFRRRGKLGSAGSALFATLAGAAIASCVVVGVVYA